MADTTAGVAVLPSVAVRLSNRLGYDACADIVALLAFPKDEHKRLKFARAIRWQYVVQRARSEPEWHTDLPVSQFMPREHEDLDLLFKQGNKHLENRNGSAHVGFEYAVEALREVYTESGFGKWAGKLGEHEEISLADMFNQREKLPGAVTARQQWKVWGEGLPVLHLAMAFHRRYYLLPPKSPERAAPIALALVVMDPCAVLEEAERYRHRLASAPVPTNTRGIRSRPKLGKGVLAKIIPT